MKTYVVSVRKVKYFDLTVIAENPDEAFEIADNRVNIEQDLDETDSNVLCVHEKWLIPDFPHIEEVQISVV